MDGFKQFFSSNNQIGQAIAHKLPPSMSATNGHTVHSLPQHGGVMRPFTPIYPVIQHSTTPVQQSPPVQPSTGNFQTNQVQPVSHLDPAKASNQSLYLTIGGVLVIGYLLLKK